MDLVERDDVLTDFERAVGEAITGYGAFVFLAGEAGIGKSSVVRALVDAPDTDYHDPQPEGGETRGTVHGCSHAGRAGRRR